MMKLLTLFILSINIISCTQIEPNTLKLSGESIDDIVPSNWRVLDSQLGDLNRDGVTDLVFAIQDSDSANFKLSDELEGGTIDMNPRVLGVYFGTKSGLFKQYLISENFIIPRDTPRMDEPLDGLNITKRGVLEINFRFWYSSGSWSTSNYKYKFRFQESEFTLIGYDSKESHRGSGETTDYSINFLARKMKITRGNFSNDTPESIEWRDFQLDNLITFRTIETPFNIKFEGVYL